VCSNSRSSGATLPSQTQLNFYRNKNWEVSQRFLSIRKPLTIYTVL